MSILCLEFIQEQDSENERTSVCDVEAETGSCKVDDKEGQKVLESKDDNPIRMLGCTKVNARVNWDAESRKRNGGETKKT